MSRLSVVLVAIVFWSALGLLFALPAIGQPGEFLPTLGNALAQWWAWGLVTVAIAAADRRLPFTDRQLGLRVLAHVPLGIVFTVAYMYVAALLLALMGLGSWRAAASLELLGMALRGMALWSILNYWLIVGGLTAYRYYERYLRSELQRERVERLSTEARLQALRYQLDPHFLFNALNTVSAQVESDPRQARRMLEHLGDLLRLTLASNGRTQVTLDEELAFLEHYLAIQRIRFGDRLRIEVDVDGLARRALVPSMLLQPLVENAIRHGVSPRAAGGSVRVSARIVDDSSLSLRVEDDGQGLPETWSLPSSSGLGLSITRQRLEGLYPDRAHALAISPRDGGGVVAQVRLPLDLTPAPVREHAHV